MDYDDVMKELARFDRQRKVIETSLVSEEAKKKLLEQLAVKRAELERKLENPLPPGPKGK